MPLHINIIFAQLHAIILQPHRQNVNKVTFKVKNENNGLHKLI